MVDRSQRRKFRFWGYEIADWSSLVALIVSLGTLSWTMYDKFFVWPSPQLVPPEIVEFWCKDTSFDAVRQREICDEEAYLLVRASTLTFLNRAPSPHSYVVKTLSANVSFMNADSAPKKSLHLPWQYFSEISISDQDRKPVAPFTVDGNAAVAKEVEFYPRREIDPDEKSSRPTTSERYKFSDFQSLISSEAIKNISLLFEATVFDSNAPVTAVCQVPVDQDFVHNASVSYPLFSRECHAM
jgi:hypothetical protein